MILPPRERAYDRAVAMSARVNRASLPLLNLLSVRNDFLLTLDLGPGAMIEIPGEKELMADQPPQLRWALVGAFACIALITGASEIIAEPAMQLLTQVSEGLKSWGAAWGLLYAVVAGDTAAALWLLGRTDHLELLEASIRRPKCWPRISAFRSVMAGSRWLVYRPFEAVMTRRRSGSPRRAPSLMRTDGSHCEPSWTTMKRLMYQRRNAPGDAERARPLFAKALEQFRTIEMPGWIQRAELAAEAKPIDAKLAS